MAKESKGLKVIRWLKPIRLALIACFLLIVFLLIELTKVTSSGNVHIFLRETVPISAIFLSVGIFAMLADQFLPDKLAWWADPVTGEVERE